MAVRRYRFSSYHPVLRHQLHANVPMVAKWNLVVGGNGTLEGAIVLPDDPDQVEAIRQATEELSSAIYVRSNVSNVFQWGGPVVERRVQGNILKVACVEWRSWPFQLVVPPAANADIYYSFDNIDQMSISRTVLQAGVGAGTTEGAHPLTYTSQSSGKLRDLHFYGSEMKRAGDLIDSMANRDGGFEWTLQPLVSTDGLPRMNFHCFYPQQGNVLDSLVFKATKKGGNCVPGEILESGTTRYSRYWATGTGQAPDQLFAYDQDPNLSGGSVLRFDGSTSYSTVNVRSTLASNARRARKFYAPGTNLVTVTHNMEQIDPDLYTIGDRGRLIVQDRWNMIDQNARIISKEVDISGAGTVTTVLDLTDETLPEVDEGGVV